MPYLAMYRHEELRAQQRVDELQLLLAGVAGDVGLGDVVVEHLGALLHQGVYYVGYISLVARNGVG